MDNIKYFTHDDILKLIYKKMIDNYNLYIYLRL